VESGKKEDKAPLRIDVIGGGNTERTARRKWGEKIKELNLTKLARRLQIRYWAERWPIA